MTRAETSQEMQRMQPAESDPTVGQEEREFDGGIAVLDFGGQYSHLICRRIRALGVYASFLRYDTSVEELRKLRVAGVVFSGGPSSVYEPSAPKPDNRIFSEEIPILGICYGYQLLVQAYGGNVRRASKREYGSSTLTIKKNTGIFAGIGEKRLTCWMSHSDSAARLPRALRVLAVTKDSRCAAVASEDGRHYGVQFHPEVAHTQEGNRILSNFVFGVCHATKGWNLRDFVRDTTNEIARSTSGRILCAVSGGVDSTTTATLLHKAVGERVQCVFIDNGLLRDGEANEVLRTFRDRLSIPVAFVDASKRFLRALEGVTNPEEKRRTIGRVFAEVFEEFATKNGPFNYLAQGTLYPDVIESGSTSAPASVIKTHHNVGGMPEDLSLQVVEPLRELYKDEVREVARLLGLPTRILRRQPFPGPGLAVRILGEVNEEKLRICRGANRIVEEVMKKHRLQDSVWQSFAYVGDDRVVGVLGDARRMGHQVTVKAVESLDAMTADWSRISYGILAEMSNRITNEVDGVVAVAYSISSKPPATIEPQ